MFFDREERFSRFARRDGRRKRSFGFADIFFDDLPEDFKSFLDPVSGYIGIIDPEDILFMLVREKEPPGTKAIFFRGICLKFRAPKSLSEVRSR